MSLPRHIAIIPDGNRRWARKKGKPPYFGHHAGMKSVERIVEAAHRLGIPYLTVWGASPANLQKRQEKEVKVLFRVFERYFGKLLNGRIVQEHGVRVRVLGRWRELLPGTLKAAIKKVLEKTRGSGKYHLTILLGYSGTDEMLAAVTKIRRSGEKVTERTVKRNLWTKDLPPVDLVIRTGGEPHLSAGFMMWDTAEARLYFTETLWPDFSEKEFKDAVERFSKTNRRYGG